jgi:asparagine synthetase B (glutamine-hydrolysing)
MPRAPLARVGDEREYVERFREVLSAAVRDRIRNTDAVVQLSGGMDCTSVAALAASHAPAQRTRLAAYTVTVDRLFPDEGEAWLAGTVAERLAIPLTMQPLAQYPLFARASASPLPTAEPLASADIAVQYDSLAPIAQTSIRVLLSGQGGDALFAGRPGMAAELVAQRRWLTLLGASWRHYRALGTLRGLGLRRALLSERMSADATAEWKPRFPDWLDPDFVRRAALEDRWHAGWTIFASASDAREQLSTPWLSRTFEDYEALRLPVVARHPFFDVRVATHVAALPTHVTANKRVLREAMRGRLPEAVRLRQKTSLAGDPIRARVAAASGRRAFRSAFARAGELYIDRQRYRAAFERYVAGEGGESTWSSNHMITPIALDNWMTEHGR